MKCREDSANSENKALEDIASSRNAEFEAKTSFLRNNILELGENKIDEYVSSNQDLQLYRQYFHDLFRQEKHILSKETETVLATISETNETARNIFETFIATDITFGTVKDENSNKVQLTHAKYQTLLKSPCQKVRIAAQKTYMSEWQKYKNTITTMHSQSVKKGVNLAKARKFNSALEHALFTDNIPKAVYDNLFSAINDHLPALHRYYALRKKALKLTEMFSCDGSVSIVEDVDVTISYEEAKAKISESLTPFGEDYKKTATDGLENGWVDVYENTGKTTGAFAWGTFGTHPYILMNYEEKGLTGISTLAHELGHAMHFYYTWDSQPVVYSDYTMFLAEVASTVNEIILMKHMQATATDPKLKIYLLVEQIKQFTGTVFFQALLSEFEAATHAKVESGEALTLDNLNASYHSLLKKYHGEALTIDEYAEYNWARIPHFYRPFYLHQYAIGYLTAVAFADKITVTDPAEQKQNLDMYLGFLKSGCSAYSIDILKNAGVDLSTPAPFKDALKIFDNLVTELENLLM